MGSSLGRVPVLRISVQNPFSGAVYPEVGSVQAVVGTGYDGFLAVPPRIYRGLQLDSAHESERSVLTGDGRRVESKSSFASVRVAGTGKSYDSPVETLPGVEEALLGTSLLSRLRVTMNHRTGVFRIDLCPRAASSTSPA